MKTSKLFTIDTELADRLGGVDNASSLINDLLSEYFSVRADKNTLFDQKKAVLIDLKKKHKKPRKKLKSWKILKNLILIIIALFGYKKHARMPNQVPLKLQRIEGGGTYVTPRRTS